MPKLFFRAGVRCVRHRCVVPQPLPIPLPFPHIFPDDNGGSAQGRWCNGIMQGAVLLLICLRHVLTMEVMHSRLPLFLLWRLLCNYCGGAQSGYAVGSVTCHYGVCTANFAVNSTLHVPCIQGQIMWDMAAAIDWDLQMVQPACLCLPGSALPQLLRTWPRHSWSALKVRLWSECMLS